jgi:hypothetical protein
MTITTFVARFFSVSLFVVGLSHAMQPKQWRDFFLLLKQTGVAGIIIAMFTFPVGLMLVVGHNIWVFDVPVIITISGWGMIIKSLTYALIPGRAEKMIPNDSDAHRKYAWAGAASLPFSLLLIWHSFFRAS